MLLTALNPQYSYNVNDYTFDNFHVDLVPVGQPHTMCRMAEGGVSDTIALLIVVADVVVHLVDVNVVGVVAVADVADVVDVVDVVVGC